MARTKPSLIRRLFGCIGAPQVKADHRINAQARQYEPALQVPDPPISDKAPLHGTQPQRLVQVGLSVNPLDGSMSLAIHPDGTSSGCCREKIGVVQAGIITHASAAPDRLEDIMPSSASPPPAQLEGRLQVRITVDPDSERALLAIFPAGDQDDASAASQPPAMTPSPATSSPEAQHPKMRTAPLPPTTHMDLSVRGATAKLASPFSCPAGQDVVVGKLTSMTSLARRQEDGDEQRGLVETPALVLEERGSNGSSNGSEPARNIRQVTSTQMRQSQQPPPIPPRLSSAQIQALRSKRSCPPPALSPAKATAVACGPGAAQQLAQPQAPSQAPVSGRRLLPPTDPRPALTTGRVPLAHRTSCPLPSPPVAANLLSRSNGAGGWAGRCGSLPRHARKLSEQPYEVYTCTNAFSGGVMAMVVPPPPSQLSEPPPVEGPLVQTISLQPEAGADEERPSNGSSGSRGSKPDSSPSTAMLDKNTSRRRPWISDLMSKVRFESKPSAQPLLAPATTAAADSTDQAIADDTASAGEQDRKVPVYRAAMRTLQKAFTLSRGRGGGRERGRVCPAAEQIVGSEDFESFSSSFHETMESECVDFGNGHFVQLEALKKNNKSKKGGDKWEKKEPGAARGERSEEAEDAGAPGEWRIPSFCCPTPDRMSDNHLYDGLRI